MPSCSMPWGQKILLASLGQGEKHKIKTSSGSQGASKRNVRQSEKKRNYFDRFMLRKIYFDISFN